jgi:hypothetical protein
MIRWDPKGEQIIVERPEQLALHVLPSIYRQSRFASFSRQLNVSSCINIDLFKNSDELKTRGFDFFCFVTFLNPQPLPSLPISHVLRSMDSCVKSTFAMSIQQLTTRMLRHGVCIICPSFSSNYRSRSPTSSTD